MLAFDPKRTLGFHGRSRLVECPLSTQSGQRGAGPSACSLGALSGDERGEDPFTVLTQLILKIQFIRRS